MTKHVFPIDYIVNKLTLQLSINCTYRAILKVNIKLTKSNAHGIGVKLYTNY